MSGRKTGGSHHRVDALREPPPKMQILCSVLCSVQAYHPELPEIAACIPAACPFCGRGRLSSRGTYFRALWLPQAVEIEVRVLRCGRADCGRSVSLLPSFAVPFKRYSAAIVESCLKATAGSGGSPAAWCSSTGWTDRTTAGAWLRQFAATCGTVLTEGLRRLSGTASGALRDPVRQLWRRLRQWAGARPVLPSVQAALCLGHPPLGLFRPRL